MQLQSRDLRAQPLRVPSEQGVLVRDAWLSALHVRDVGAHRSLYGHTVPTL